MSDKVLFVGGPYDGQYRHIKRMTESIAVYAIGTGEMPVNPGHKYVWADCKEYLVYVGEENNAMD